MSAIFCNFECSVNCLESACGLRVDLEVKVTQIRVVMGSSGMGNRNFFDLSTFDVIDGVFGT